MSGTTPDPAAGANPFGELAKFALAATELLDRDSPSYTLDVLSVIESTLDNPYPVLSAQKFKARGEAVQAIKSEGI